MHRLGDHLMLARLASALVGLLASGVAEVVSSELNRLAFTEFKALGDVAAVHLADDDGEVVDAARLLAYVRGDVDVTGEDVAVRVRGAR